MGTEDVPVGSRGEGVGSTLALASSALGVSTADTGPDSGDLLSNVLIEQAVREKDQKDQDADWKGWPPKLESKWGELFKDRILNLVAERFKLDAISQAASERGIDSFEGLVKLISDSAGPARQRFPRLHFLDAIWKYLGDPNGR